MNIKCLEIADTELMATSKSIFVIKILSDWEIGIESGWGV